MRKVCFVITLTLAALSLLLGIAAAEPEQDATAPFEAGVAALTQGNPTLAVEKFTAALKDNPEMVEAFINRGIAEMQLSLWADAVGDFDQALDLAPNSPEALYNRGLAYSRQNVFDKALADYTQAAKFAPKDWQIYYNRGNTYLDMKKAQEALKDYNRALKLHPKAPDILHNRSLAYLALDKPQPALADADQVHRPQSQLCPGLLQQGAGPGKTGQQVRGPGSLPALFEHRQPRLGRASAPEGAGTD